MTTAVRPMTVEESCHTKGFADGKHELVKGVIVFTPPTGLRHGEVQGLVGFVIKMYLLSNRIGRVLTESGAITERDPDSVRGPGISYYSQERLPLGTQVVAYHSQPPDLVAEVMSPAGCRPAMRAKAREYLAAGVRVVWVVDPDDRTVMVDTEPTRATLLEADAILTAEAVLPGFSCRVADLFP